MDQMTWTYEASERFIELFRFSAFETHEKAKGLRWECENQARQCGENKVTVSDVNCVYDYENECADID